MSQINAPGPDGMDPLSRHVELAGIMDRRYEDKQSLTFGVLLDSMLEGEGFFPNDESICQRGHRAMKDNRRAAPAQPDLCQCRDKNWNGDRTFS